MRVLYCIPTFLGGGAERQLAYLSGAMVGLGHEVHVALMTDGPHGARTRSAGAELHILGHRAPYDPTVFWELCSLIRELRPAVVHTWLPRMDFWGGLAALTLRRPWVCSERSSASAAPTWREATLRRVIKYAGAVVANSETGATPWRLRLGERVPVYVIPNALPIDEVRAAPLPLRSVLGIGPDAEVIVFAGRFTPEKNIAMLTEVLSTTLKKRPRALALCCGEGALLETFKAEVAARGLSSRCRALGYRQDLWSLMKLADVFLSTSETEGRPNAVLEAMGCGCQLVLSDIAQHRELVPAEAGLFFPHDDAAKAVETLAAALEAPPEARRGRAEAASRAAECFSVVAMAQAYQNLYHSLAQSNGRL